MKITKIKSNSLAEKIGMQPGDRLLKINGKKVIDELDYKFRITEELLILDLEINGKLDRVEIEKEYDDDLGVLFEEMKIRACANDCVFCFVDQNPKGLRKSLFFRDGDFRLSYLYGHYITLTNMGKKELTRIVEQKLSPLYISIHTTDEKQRQELLLYKKNDNLLEKLEYLISNGITLYGQVVLMPGVNDKNFLIKTLRDSYHFYPGLKSITIVPVGLTEHRQGLMNLKSADSQYAKYLINSLDGLRDSFPGKKNPFVLLSDEWYLLAKINLPPLSDYGEEDLSENGVGQVQSFYNNFIVDFKRLPKKLSKPYHFSIVTGTLIYPFFKDKVVKELNKIHNLKVSLYQVKNDLFGHVVTVAGLLGGQDIINQLKDKDLGSSVWMTDRILNETGSITLDDMTPEYISDQLGVPFKTTSDSIEYIFKEEKIG